MTVVSQAELMEHPRRAAGAALSALPPGPFVVHLDVDVLDFLDAPIAENLNGRNSGPSLTQLEPVLEELWRHPDCWALSIGQLDPAHAIADPTAIPRLIDVLAAAASVGPGRVS
jgi:arginase